VIPICFAILFRDFEEIIVSLFPFYKRNGKHFCIGYGFDLTTTRQQLRHHPTDPVLEWTIRCHCNHRYELGKAVMLDKQIAINKATCEEINIGLVKLRRRR
jgi:hypothetical protein